MNAAEGGQRPMKISPELLARATDRRPGGDDYWRASAA
jgi:hypothetical protein